MRAYIRTCIRVCVCVCVCACVRACVHVLCVYNNFSNFAQGVFEGFTGVVVQPIRGTVLR